MSTEPTVRRLSPDEWEMARAVRVAALTDAPSAFGSTVARELSLSEEQWRARLAGSAWFTGLRGADAVALACGVPADAADERHLTGMWVALSERGTGLAGVLVSHVIDWARADGARRLQLWVVAENARAIGLYDKHGFTFTGRTQPLPRDPQVLEVEMVAVLA
ncbi:MAG: hypothetical protein QOC60_1765 [Frankiaceae bacterium]|jgi:GNAT superfamily N-acetyltransferase|nr:hypothetical protein [Frankiaceae bacterium]MDQ1715820.1 hypothetical protein [Frankiaceae bacterium]